VLSDDEIVAVFKMIDQRQPVHKNKDFRRLSLEYKIILRLIYCCGLRISEARLLKNQDVNIESGTLRIMQSKGHKDRLVYFTSDMKQLLQRYHNEMLTQYNCQAEWFFPGRYPDRPLPVVTIDMVFRNAWNQTPFAAICDKAPTVHSLRHTFVVKRMNLWMEQGVSLKEMLPYLSRYLGHASPNETFYYYHQVDSAFRIVRQRDKSSSSVIPEVTADEKE
jgi:integrase